MTITKSQLFKNHLERLKSSTLNRFTMESIPEWITTNTFINGEPYSYRDHEYQYAILSDGSREIVVRKCSQVGLSETSARMALALCAVTRGYTVAYTLPTAGFASTFMKTRIDPVIQGSPYLKDMLQGELDNTEVKKIGDSFLYLRGAQSSNAPISVPCDHLIHDEVDFSDPEVLSQYQSRLTHSKFKRKTKLSTPTLPDRGIDYEFQRSRRKFNMVKCSCCGHYFIPDYFSHIRVPGFTGDLRDITKVNLHKVRYSEAYVECPSCGGQPSLQPEHREWVCENPGDNFVASGFQVSPFDAPNIITPGFLIEASTQYKRYVDFINFGLGLPTLDQDATLTMDELAGCIGSELDEFSGSTVMGIDMGMLCHVVVGRVRADCSIRIVHLEQVPASKIRERYGELRRQWAPRITIMDSQPYTETVMSLQQTDQSLYGAVYTRLKGLDLFKVLDREEEWEEAVRDLRQINVNRDKALDALMDFIRSNQLSKRSCELDEVWKKQLTDMRRIKDWDKQSQEVVFKWVKSEQGEDHFHHATLYMYIASMVMGAGRGSLVTLPLLSTFKVKPSQDATNWPSNKVGGRR